MKKTLGGDRLGSGNKMQVELHGYERSNHDLSYIWRSTMSVGTLPSYNSTPDINANIGSDMGMAVDLLKPYRRIR